MAGVRRHKTRKKLSLSVTKNSHKNKLKRRQVKRRPSLPSSRYCHKLITENWDKNCSVARNYNTLGLARDANAYNKSNRLNNNKNTTTTNTNNNNSVVDMLDKAAKSDWELKNTYKRLYMDWHERGLIGRLMEKWGTDYCGMRGDFKLNTWQYSEGQLKRKCAQYKQLTA